LLTEPFFEIDVAALPGGDVFILRLLEYYRTRRGDARMLIHLFPHRSWGQKQKTPSSYGRRFLYFGSW